MPGWSYEIAGNAVVWDFREWTDPDHAEITEVMETFEEVTEDVTASVTLLAEEGDIDEETSDTIEAYRDVHDRNGVERVAFVPPDVEGLALKGELGDVPGLAVGAFDDAAAARE